jgi:hypothetical protein
MALIRLVIVKVLGKFKIVCPAIPEKRQFTKPTVPIEPENVMFDELSNAQSLIIKFE